MNWKSSAGIDGKSNNLNLWFERELRRSTREVLEWMEHAICKYNIDVSSQSNDKRFMSDIMLTLSALKDDKGTPFPEITLRDNGVGLILGGRDTWSVALTWFFWLLNQNPEAEERILEEIQGIVGERENHFIVEFNPHEVKRMEYLHAALSETLRLYPSVPVEIWKAREEDVFPDGTIIRKGAKIFYSIYAMGRMKSVWGEDWREFKPER
ncbi:hypothetical protein GIB67_025520 [Kingdonia uniflora]|uniref:Cytochrome P450 n=1 Tax=Kingdonia uniflora TaxID=39325 RepID=A0A7J7M0A0_9MAGN|nr:hypothetical protein GIB67_025520 [Kingdonia uniflora]